MFHLISETTTIADVKAREILDSPGNPTGDRLVDLLDSMLGDLGLARHYETADGICLRHLPLAIIRCRQPGNVSFLLRTQYTRLAVIHWELEEYWRKRDWTHRWEPRGDEQTAWCRAINQYTEGRRYLRSPQASYRENTTACNVSVALLKEGKYNHTVVIDASGLLCQPN